MFWRKQSFPQGATPVKTYHSAVPHENSAFKNFACASLLAHLSRRLTGELIGYPWIRRTSSSSVRRPSSVRPSSVVRRPFTFSNIFSSETAWPIKAKFYVEPPWEGGTKVCINGPGHMTGMAAMPIYGKNLKKSSSPEPVGRFPQNLVCSFGDSCPS